VLPPGSAPPPRSLLRPGIREGGLPTGPEFSEVSSLNLLFGSIEIERLMRLSWYIQVALRLVSAYIFSWTSVGLVVVFVVEEASWTVISRRLRQSFINFRADQNSLLPDRLQEPRPIWYSGGSPYHVQVPIAALADG